MTLEQDIKDKALELGFNAVGITDAGPIGHEDIASFRAWLDADYAAQMDYLHRNFEKRTHPAALLDGAQSVIVVALNYKPATDEIGPGPSNDPCGTVAQYARYEDYHGFMKVRLGRLAEFVGSVAGRDARFKICVDSVPLAERALAVKAGLGFIGASGMFIHPTLGPQLFLGELITTVKLSIDEPKAGVCISCGRCVRLCPTGALQADGSFDANKCISYLTIEHKDAIAPDLAAKIGDRVYGCDVCVLVCPHHHGAPGCDNAELKYYPERARLNLRDILDMDQASFDVQFGDSPIRRLGPDRLKRNAIICIENVVSASDDS